MTTLNKNYTQQQCVDCECDLFLRRKKREKVDKEEARKNQDRKYYYYNKKCRISSSISLIICTIHVVFLFHILFTFTSDTAKAGGLLVSSAFTTTTTSSSLCRRTCKTSSVLFSLETPSKRSNIEEKEEDESNSHSAELELELMSAAIDYDHTSTTTTTLTQQHSITTQSQLLHKNNGVEQKKIVDMKNPDIELLNDDDDDDDDVSKGDLVSEESTNTTANSSTIVENKKITESDIITANYDKIIERNSQDEQEKVTRREKQTDLIKQQDKISLKRLWRRRHARSIDEGIRSEKVLRLLPTSSSTSSNTKTKNNLSNLLKQQQKKQKKQQTVSRSKNNVGGGYSARTLAGLIVALAEEALDLRVEVDARNDTPLSKKYVNSIQVFFTRLGCAPLRFGALDQAIRDNLNAEDGDDGEDEQEKEQFSNKQGGSYGYVTADQAFESIDLDNSGALDADELAEALSMALMETQPQTQSLSSSQQTQSKLQSQLQTSTQQAQQQRLEFPKEMLTGLASRLVSLYDSNGDDELDREEYENMVRDMATLRDSYNQTNKKRKGKGLLRDKLFFWRKRNDDYEDEDEVINQSLTITNSTITPITTIQQETTLTTPNNIDDGSIVLSDLKLDLRQLLFGSLPLVKKILPGGPLVLEPFTATVSASFNANDIMNSFLLDRGLRILVARALKRRVRDFRDLVDGAVWYGRTWNMACKTAPIVEVPKLENIEFDEFNRAIISGRAKIKASPDAPFIENAFKLRTKIGTRQDGHVIGLKEPELALVVECPKAWERNIVSACTNFNLPIPRRPDPIYTFIPLVSPLKKTNNDGYYMGEDNRLKSIEIKNGALHFEMSSVLRPGRFLGNHYIAFTCPQRSLIVTMDRVRNGMRVARRNKRKADEEEAKLMKAKKAKAKQQQQEEEQKRKTTATTGGGVSDNTFMEVPTNKFEFLDPLPRTTTTTSTSTSTPPSLYRESSSYENTPPDMYSSTWPTKKNNKQNNKNNKNQEVQANTARTNNFNNDNQKGEEKEEEELKGFFNRFMKGYTMAQARERNQQQENNNMLNTIQLTSAISEWFGRQQEGDASSSTSGIGLDSNNGSGDGDDSNTQSN